MGTSQPMQQSNGANGNGANGNGENLPFLTKCAVTGKRSFPTKLEAEQFESENRTRNGKQYVYACEDCPAYHLTSTQPGLPKTNLKLLENSAGAASSAHAPSNRRGWGETEADVKRLWKEGRTDAEIASQLGIGIAAVAYHRKKFGSANGRVSSPGARLRVVRVPQTLAECDEEQRALDEEHQSKSKALEQQRQRLEEATKLTVGECEEGKSLSIRFGHTGHLVLPKAKVIELTENLMSWVS